MFVKSTVLSQFPELVHGMSNASLGNMSYKKGDPDADKNNRTFYAILGIDPERYQILNPELRHGGNVAVVQPNFLKRGYTGIKKDSGEAAAFEKGPLTFTSEKDAYRGIDACVSNSPKCLITIRPADCAPVFLYCPCKQVFGIAHASTASLFSGIIERTINMMRGYFGCNSSEIFVFVGPSISSAAYKLCTTGLYKRVLSKTMTPEQVAAYDPKGKIVEELHKAGILPDHIEVSPICTASSNGEFFSNYASKGKDTRRHLAVIGLR